MTTEGTTVDKVGIGLLGYGTVGSGVGKLLRKSADDIRLATGKDVVLARARAARASATRSSSPAS